MKLVGSLLCVAALSVVGCADEVSVGGGQGEGITPAKVSFVDPYAQTDPFHLTVQGMKAKGGAEPADVICPDCEVFAFTVENNNRVDEVRMVKDGGAIVCRIYLKDDQIVLDECGWVTP